MVVVNPQPSTIRSLIAVAAGLALTLAACGGGDDDTADTTVPATDPAPATTEASGDVAPAMQPASITFEAQSTDGASVTIASVDLPAAGFIAVHDDGGGSPGPVIGNSNLLQAGTSSDVVVTLDAVPDDGSTLYPMVHIDTDGNGVYEFGTVEGVDGPGLTAGGDVAVVGAVVTFTGDQGLDDTDDTDDTVDTDDSDDTSDAAPADGATITIADFAFDGITEVAVGTTVVVTNTDSAPHTWTAVDGAFDSGSLGQGETFEFTFDTAGEFEYFCNFHPSMTGTITVTG